MHNAPSVSYPLGRSRFQGGLLGGFWLAGSGVTLWWALAAPRLDWRFGVAWVVVVAAGIAAWRGWCRAPRGQLRWDGQVWQWESAGYQAGTPVQALSVALDFQRVLLLRVENQDHVTLWLWAHRASMPERWLDLRRAVYSRRRALPTAMLPDSPSFVGAKDFPDETDPPRLSP
jgi:hypothetical protein